MELNSIYPDQFFNLPHPAAPVVDIQLRTKIDTNNTDITNSDHWESITFNPNNFFNDITLEDSGGAYKVNVSLLDKNFSYLENVIVKSILATKMANQLVENPDFSTEEPSYFEFWSSKKRSTNLRVRFGYSESHSDDYINATSLKDKDWLERDGTANSMKPVIKTPWIYFQIIKTDFNLTSKGLEVNLEAFSIMDNFLDKAKLVESYTKLFGNPVYVIEQLMFRIQEAAEGSGDTITFEISEDPLPRGHIARDGDEELIEVMLGGEPVIKEDGTIATRYKSVRTLLNEVVAAVKEIKYDKNGDIVPASDDSSEEAIGDIEENEEAVQIFRYSYYVIDTEEETRIVFYYKDPNKSLNEQKNIRTYVWMEEGNSIVKELDINTKTDFAMLNLPIVNISNSTGEITAQIARGSGEEESDEDVVDYTIQSITDVSEAFSNENFRSMFVADVNYFNEDEVMNDRLSAKQIGALMASRVVANLNEQVFTGTITLFGDPFYLFDDIIKPFMYLIKIIVNRPNYVDVDGNFVTGGKSYLSGYYAVKKITHEISTSGFETKLEVMKFNSNGR